MLLTGKVGEERKSEEEETEVGAGGGIEEKERGGKSRTDTEEIGSLLSVCGRKPKSPLFVLLRCRITVSLFVLCILINILSCHASHGLSF